VASSGVLKTRVPEGPAAEAAEIDSLERLAVRAASAAGVFREQAGVVA